MALERVSCWCGFGGLVISLRVEKSAAYIGQEHDNTDEIRRFQGGMAVDKNMTIQIPQKLNRLLGLFASTQFHVKISTAKDLLWVLVFKSVDGGLVTDHCSWPIYLSLVLMATTLRL